MIYRPIFQGVVLQEVSVAAFVLFDSSELKLEIKLFENRMVAPLQTGWPTSGNIKKLSGRGRIQHFSHQQNFLQLLDEPHSSI